MFRFFVWILFLSCIHNWIMFYIIRKVDIFGLDMIFHSLDNAVRVWHSLSLSSCHLSRVPPPTECQGGKVLTSERSFNSGSHVLKVLLRCRLF